MIYDDIKNFNKQFEYEPLVQNAKRLKRFKRYVVCGMGGSHLAADLVKVWRPDFPITAWPNYGLPLLPLKELKEHLVIASSYSGNTEETIDAFGEALKRHIPVAAVAAGGKLIRLAEKARVPYIQIPDWHIQPRLATGLGLKAILALMGEKAALKEVAELANTLKPSRHEAQGKNLAKAFHGSIPIIYSSAKNLPIAYNWKIKFNETGKIPAFCNALPELNHNEMTGFDLKDTTGTLSHRFHFVFLKDHADHPRIIKRMNVLEGLLRQRNFGIETLFLGGEDIWLKVFNSLVLADWTAYYTAKGYGVEPEKVPMVEEFKKLIK